jgi:DNA-binding CsgD family transcriptional regulator
MLSIVEKSLQALGRARSDGEIARVLDELADRFGFRSAYLIEYANRLTKVQRVVDTNAARREWWSDFLASDLRPAPRDVAAMLAGDTVKRYDSNRFGPGSDRLRAACEAHDVVDLITIPISFDGELVGVAGFCGNPPLGRQEEMALQLVAYTAFAHLRGARAPVTGDITLTPREREVMRLSAQGLTSAEIAGQLGMSTRTANQHVDNVADKLGTRNRAHTVAEILRRGLI